MHNELILLKCGEIALKGLNRASFEDMLIRNAKRAVQTLGEFKFYKAQSTIYAQPVNECDMKRAADRLSRVFGVAALCPARIVEKDFEAIKKAAADYLGDALSQARSFKVEAKRSDKSFPMNSPEICRELGGFLLDEFQNLKVDVINPEITVVVEIRDFAAYIHENQMSGAGGIPVGSGGNAALLISGGIDSPVAGYMMAKRGLVVSGIHFVSPPYTSVRAQEKVESLCSTMSRYCGRIKLFIVPFTKIQEEIKKNCPEDLFTIIMRRFMMEISERIAVDNDCAALVTGESVGQVASQTLLALACTQAAVKSLPVLRPVIGMDKEEIISISRKIGTFDTSIQPYDDCCTVFTPRHPRTRPKLADVVAAEAVLDRETLIAEAIDGVYFKIIDGREV